MTRSAAITVLAAVVGALAGSSLLSPVAGAAEPVVFDAVDVPFVDDPNAQIYRSQDLAQSFRASASYRLSRVEVMVDDLDSGQPTDPLTLTMETDAGGVPSGAVLAIAQADGEFGYAWLAFDLTPMVNVTAGARYWLVLEDHNDMNQQSGYRWARKVGGAYLAGNEAVRVGGGSWTAPTEDDFLFRAWGTGPAANVGGVPASLALPLLLAAIVSVALFAGYRVFGVGARDKADIQQLFLLHRSGLLIKHYSRHLHAGLDTDILAAMIVAVQNFVRDSFRTGTGDLEEMKFGPHKILLIHGRDVILAAVVSGNYRARLRTVLVTGTRKLEEAFQGRLAEWNGVVDELDGIDGFLDEILRVKVVERAGRDEALGRDVYGR